MSMSTTCGVQNINRAANGNKMVLRDRDLRGNCYSCLSHVAANRVPCGRSADNNCVHLAVLAWQAALKRLRAGCRWSAIPLIVIKSGTEIDEKWPFF